jgi:hypothetical protein
MENRIKVTRDVQFRFDAVCPGFTYHLD